MLIILMPIFHEPKIERTKGEDNHLIKIIKYIYKLTTLWLIKCAINVTDPKHWDFSFRRYARLNCTMHLVKSNSPIFGNWIKVKIILVKKMYEMFYLIKEIKITFVLIMATKAANTWV